MIYLSGVLHPKLPAGLGTVVNPNMGNRPLPGRPWGADNGCFSQGRAFDGPRFMAWLAKSSDEERRRCLFAVAPDVLGDAVATLERSAPFYRPIRALGYKVALVAQDGLTPAMVPWDEIDCLFIGGTTAWKISVEAHAVAVAAKQHGKWLHMGRVNGHRRMCVAIAFGCDSADGTYLRTAPDFLLPRLSAWLQRAQENPCLPLLPAV